MLSTRDVARLTRAYENKYFDRDRVTGGDLAKIVASEDSESMNYVMWLHGAVHGDDFISDKDVSITEDKLNIGFSVTDRNFIKDFVQPRFQYAWTNKFGEKIGCWTVKRANQLGKTYKELDLTEAPEDLKKDVAYSARKRLFNVYFKPHSSVKKEEIAAEALGGIAAILPTVSTNTFLMDQAQSMAVEVAAYPWTQGGYFADDLTPSIHALGMVNSDDSINVLRRYQDHPNIHYKSRRNLIDYYIERHDKAKK